MSDNQPGTPGQQTTGVAGQPESHGESGPPQQPGPYGASAAPGAPLPPHGGRGSKGRTIGIVVGALIVVAAVVGGIVLFTGGAGTAYKLTTPKTLTGGYERDGKGKKGDGRAFDNKKVPGMTSHADVSAEYKAGTRKKLQLGGAYGTVKDPGKAVDWVFAQTGKSLRTETGAKARGGTKEFSPSGFDGDVLKCQEYKIAEMGLAMCSWADGSTVGTISSIELTSDGTATEPVDLAKTAALTAKVRKDALVETD